MYVYVTRVRVHEGGQERASDPRKLEGQAVVSGLVKIAGNRTQQFLWTGSSKASSLLCRTAARGVYFLSETLK